MQVGDAVEIIAGYSGYKGRYGTLASPGKDGFYVRIDDSLAELFFFNDELNPVKFPVGAIVRVARGDRKMYGKNGEVAEVDGSTRRVDFYGGDKDMLGVAFWFDVHELELGSQYENVDVVESPPKRQQWEYMQTDVAVKLNQFGKEGWELVTAVGTNLIWKRPL
jgi:hypothetical protein